ncbi:RNA degradosome polyphosphate kinase [Oceanotoga sp.]|uniref:RNA degradosome polyphosphate kinase n=1 Tax=Oceanotoga sp. TaxID=2108366 RepID=UPI0035A6A79C
MILLENNIYFNRELSWIEFNNRVLEEAMDKQNPVLERLKFLAITSSNLDEFFMIRVAGLKEQVEAGYEKRDISGRTPMEQLKEISMNIHTMIKKQYDCLNRSILPILKKERIRILNYDLLKKEQLKKVKKYYETIVFPVITPMAIDQSRPFPKLPNKSLNIAVSLFKENENEKIAILQVPSIIPRFYEIEISDGTKTYILLEDIIMNNAENLFPGYVIKHMSPFRITRNADLSIDEEGAEDLLQEIEKSLVQRKWGMPVRLEVFKKIDKKLLDILKTMLNLSNSDIYMINGPLDISAFMNIALLNDFGCLKYENFKPSPHKDFFNKDIFKVIKNKDILLFHPYQSFEHVVNFIERAAEDENVLAIKQTLYRVSGDSPIVEALIKAAKNGKQVTVLVELKARFDEKNNIEWAKKLEKAGCYVVYGLVGLKVHSKILLIVRKEYEGIKRYVHLSTGNYNDKTAKLYTDIGFFTSKESFGWDASALFNVLTGYSQPPEWKKFMVAPIGLQENIIKLIENEIMYAENGFKASIIIKVNSLLETPIIDALYKASQKNVKIKLIVRGICALKPGIKNLSDNIEVISIVGRFLEHTRIYYFNNGNDFKIYLSSADLMPRNLHRRVEILFSIEEKELKDELYDILKLTLEDTEKARILNSDGIYRRIDKRGKKRLESQKEFINKYKINFKESLNKDMKDMLKPKKDLERDDKYNI